jgi:hypothetical protein
LLLQKGRLRDGLRGQELEPGLFVGIKAGPQLGDGLRLEPVLCGGVLDLIRDNTDAEES